MLGPIGLVQPGACVWGWTREEYCLLSLLKGEDMVYGLGLGKVRTTTLRKVCPLHT